MGVEGAAAWRVHPAPRVPRQASPLVVMICSGPFCSSMESLPGPCTIRSSRAPTVDRVGVRVRVRVGVGVRARVRVREEQQGAYGGHGLEEEVALVVGHGEGVHLVALHTGHPLH